MEQHSPQIATFAGGCFWCIEAVFRRLRGVSKVTSGYMGGQVENPSYDQVCGGQTGHAEVVQIEFDPTVIPYTTLLEVFWAVHDPTTVNKQGNDVGTQYRSAIFYHNEEQGEQAITSMKALDASGKYDKPTVTEIVPASQFYAAEGYHQEYYDNNRNQGYCRLVIDPKIKKLYAGFGDKVDASKND